MDVFSSFLSDVLNPFNNMTFLNLIYFTHFEHFSIRLCARLVYNTRNAELITTGYEELRKFDDVRASHVLLLNMNSLGTTQTTKSGLES